MKIYLIRHGDPDYDQVTAAKYVGFGRDLSRLSEAGIQRARSIADNPIFDNIEQLVVSPYTRTMQTALEIIKVRAKELPVSVELLLHEWLPDKTGTKLKNPEQVKAAYLDYTNGTKFAELECETQTEVFERVKKVFDSYKQRNYQAIACVTHAEVIKLFAHVERVDYCEIYEIDY